jgi:hypothetical protein
MGNLTRGLINIIGSTAQRRATSCYSKFYEKKKKKKPHLILIIIITVCGKTQPI